MMFERFTREAREVVREAERQARLMHAREIGTEHLLLALADRLARLGVDAEALRRDVGREDGLDADALATLGIDLDEVRRQAEEMFGAGALDRPRGGPPPRFGKDAKKALEMTLREALRLGDRALRPEHILLALTRDERAMSLLARQGVGPDEVRTAIVAGAHGA